MAIRSFPIANTIPIYANYFHAVSLSDETTDIFSVDSFQLTPQQNYESYNVIDKIIKPLKNKSVLKPDGDKLLLPLEGLLVLPDEALAGQYPLVMIGHGNFIGYAILNFKDNPPIINQQTGKV